MGAGNCNIGDEFMVAKVRIFTGLVVLSLLSNRWWKAKWERCIIHFPVHIVLLVCSYTFECMALSLCDGKE